MATEPKKSKSTAKMIIWGIPILILLVLVVVLVRELLNDGGRAPIIQKKEVSVVQSEPARDEPETVIEDPVTETEEVEKEEVEKEETADESYTTTEPDETTEEVITEEEPGEEEVEETAEAAALEEAETEATEEATETETTEEVTEATVDTPAIVEETPEEMAERENSYIVEEGDNLWKIAAKKHDDPWKWKTILIQNKNRINYTILSEETGEWKVMVDTGKRLIIKSEESVRKNLSFDRTRKKRYALQLMSLNLDQLEKAVDIVKFLIKDGYYAYLYRTDKKIKGQFFYRIRVGFFKTEGEALTTGEEIYERYVGKKLFSTDYWAVLPSYRELSGELIDFGIQRNKPWIIQLNQHKQRKDAIDTLKSISSIAEFSYISQKKKETGGYDYRTRVGFFETRNAANKMLSKIKRTTGSLYSGAEVMEVRHIMEAAPGQATGKASIYEIKH